MKLPRKSPGNFVHVAYAVDANYGPYAGISVASVIRGFPCDGRNLHFHLLSDGIKRRDLQRVEQVTSKGNAELTVYDLRYVLGQHFDFLSRAPKHFTRAACGRLFLADVLPSAIERVIYLDSDTLALGDISELWSITRETPVMAACRENENSDTQQYKNEIGMDATAPYFNSGVLGINLSAWRHREIGPALLEIAKKMPRCKFLDQDVINVLLANQITELPAIWNVPANGAPTIEDVRIIHFSGPFKPWQLRYDGLGTTLFRHAKRASPWRYMLPELGFRRIVRRLQRSLAKRRRH